MLLKTREKHEQMSTKGEKRGFSGSIEHWMVCKVLKRNEYYLDSEPLLEPQRQDLAVAGEVAISREDFPVAQLGNGANQEVYG